MGLQYLIYKNDCIYAGAVVFLRKFILVSIFTIVPSNHVVYPFLISLILAIHLCFLLKFQPFRWTIGNQLNIIFLLLLICIFSYACMNTPLYTDSNGITIISIFILLIIIIFFLFVSYLLLQIRKNKWEKEEFFNTRERSSTDWNTSTTAPLLLSTGKHYDSS